MKLCLISDIHGDFAALELVWSHLRKLGVDQVCCAGDLVGYGPFPDRVAAFMQEHRIPCVRGNHDRWALSRALGEPDGFGGGTPSLETREYLKGLPADLVIEADGKIGVIAHGSPHSDMEFISRETHSSQMLTQFLDALGCDFLVVGHTHRPMLYRDPRGRVVLNPGSLISTACGVSSSRTFAVIETRGLLATFHDLETAELVAVESWS
jgi:putative phosphoesterase